MEKEIDKIVNNITDQAKYFLADADEFFPFGTMIKSDGSIVPLGVYLENDHPQPTEVLQVLIESTKSKLIEKEAIVIGIGLDVLYQPSGKSIKTDALKIMILTDKGIAFDYYLPYKKLDGGYVFESPLLEEGTLNL